MTPQEKILKAEERIKELKILISHWSKTSNATNYRELSIIDNTSNADDTLIAA